VAEENKEGISEKVPGATATAVTVEIGLVGHSPSKKISVFLPPGDPVPYDKVDRPLTGKHGPRLDGPRKVTGRATYTHDVSRPGMLHGRVLRSPYAHADIVSIDTSKLDAMGVVWVKPEKKKVRYHGEAVLALAASTPQLADDALHAVTVRYDVKPHTVRLVDAMRPGAPLVFEKPVEEKRSAGDAPSSGGAVAQHGNVKGPKVSGARRGVPVPPRELDAFNGEVAKALAEADATLELTLTTAVQTHVPMETHSLFAEWEGDRLKVYASTQGTFTVKDELATVLGIPKDKVEVVAEYVGGGFGAKFGAGDYGVFAAQLAKKAGKPVRLILDRKEEHLAAGNRPDSINTIKVGYKKDGTVTAVQYTSVGTAGVATGTGTGSFAKNAYDFPNVKVEESDVFTHLGPGCAMRAPGHPQGAFTVEAALDAVADACGLDPLAVRFKNDPSEVRRAEWEAAARAIGWSRRDAITKANKAAATAGLPLRRGLGCAAAVWYNIVSKGSQVQVRVHRDGTVEVENGVQEIGGGIRTAVGLVTAEELGLPVEAVSVHIGNSKYPFGPASGGSTTTASLIPAVRAAAYHAARKLAEVAAPLLGARPEDVTLGGGAFLANGKRADWAKVCGRMSGESILAIGDRAPDFDGTDPRLFGAQFVDVVVDTETGVVRVEKVAAAHSCGLAVWKTGVESQIRGGVLQGVSYALFEERVIDLPTGRFMNPNIEQYKILGAQDVPEVVTIVLDLFAGRNNAHARGIGEPAVVPTAAAIANAVSHALGSRITDLPITPARVLAASPTLQSPLRAERASGAEVRA
jgi:xanthine dehydrogenase YagR molybdenum-binding subunit